MLGTVFRHARGNAIAYLALFVALGGTSYAAVTLPRNSIGTPQLKNGAVATSKIQNGAVTAQKINASGLTVPNANNATNAGHASTADSATNAGHATTVDNATNAGHASTADNATNAGHATTADTAANANHATDASELNGQMPSFYAPATLPSGKTETGVYGIIGDGNKKQSDSVNFRIPLAAAVSSSKVVFIAAGGTKPLSCPGVGQAARGYLCVYEAVGSNDTVDSTYIIDPPTDGGPSANATGFLISIDNQGTGSFDSLGTWAVTAP